ncbi:MAG TPA: type ISP restriction/modification enzyme [Ktedonobacteraceae bacterium]|nr:type ISP restriction/modification enzyme [Ktedonobacteraceae bacterium]
MNPVETYIQTLLDIHHTGEASKETSYYNALANLLNDIGKTLKPLVHCVINPKNRGAGIPDGGLYTLEQKILEDEAPTTRIPARGAIEIKSTSEDVEKIADSEQVLRYLKRYGQVLVTNYRDFILVGQSENGKPVHLETYRLAESEIAFWNAAAHPQHMAEVHGERLTEYLKRVMLRPAPLAMPEDVAWLLASYARDAKARIEHSNLTALKAIRVDLEGALGVKFEGQKGERFFRSTLVQTLFYGVFSAWVLWCKQQGTASSSHHFDWRIADWFLHVPMIKALFEQVATPSKLGPLNIVEVLNWAGEALNRVDQTAFFARFEEDYAVQYFYEPFLQAFDPELRRELGIWYTPPEIVRYMVERVDTTLREELDIEDGLADPRVYILDPCCGTGAYLVEVLKRIATTLHEKGEDALGSHEVKKAASTRVFGFELLPAPFVVAHLQLGLLLQNLGVPLAHEKNERVGVYLTNSLTNWELPGTTPDQAVQMRFAIPEFQEERDAAEHIKQKVPVLVVLGNPPYNAFAGVSPAEEQGLVEPYKVGLVSEWGIRKFNLDDLYVRFFRLAEHRIAEKTGQGIVCYISNFSYLSDPSYVIMRQRFLREFDSLWFDCLNGDSRETGKLTPEGKPDPSVFSTEYNREGIRLGTTIGLLVRKARRPEAPLVRFRQFWGVTKRADLLRSTEVSDFAGQYEQVTTEKRTRFSFRPLKIAEYYWKWPRLVDLCDIYPFNGPIERRGNSLIACREDRANLKRLATYLNPATSDDEIRALEPRFMKSSGEFDAVSARILLKGTVRYDEQKISRYPFKPFDVRLAYLDGAIHPLFSRPSPELLALRDIPNNAFFITRDTADKDIEGPPFLFSRLVCDYDCLSGHARHIPLLVTAEQKPQKYVRRRGLFKEEEAPYITTKANLSEKARNYLRLLDITDFDSDIEKASLLWMHALAIGYAPSYLTENADGIRQDWPRIPLPNAQSSLIISAALGQQVAVLLDTENSVKGVTTGKIRPELRHLAAPARVGGGMLNPNAGDLAITVGWGHGSNNSNGNVTMPGKGKLLERPYTPDELSAIQEGTKAIGLTVEEALAHLGATTCDIYLNNVAYWQNVPSNVWRFTIGGYQVLKKWLSYREQSLLGRAITVEEMREFTGIARRLAALLLMEPVLNANYQNVKQSAYAW